MYSRYNKDKICLGSKTPTCLIFKTLTFILYDLINHPNIMGARCSFGKITKIRLPSEPLSKRTRTIFCLQCLLLRWRV